MTWMTMSDHDITLMLPTMIGGSRPSSNRTTLQMSKYKPSNSPTPTAFFEQVSCSCPRKLPPIVWLKLTRMAKDDGAFSPIGIDSLDSFPMDLCNRVVPWMTGMLKDVSACVYFEAAAQAYILDELTANLLNMLSAFDELADKTSFSLTFKFALAFIRYLLHRISLSSSGIYTQDAILQALRVLWSYVPIKNLPDEQIAALADLVEHVIHSHVFKLEPEWTSTQMSLLEVYSGMVGVWKSDLPEYRPRHNFWPALRSLVETLINQYDAPYDANWVINAPFDTMCNLLGLGLRHGVETVYDVFLETRCLDVFGSHSLRPSLVTVINGYVSGLATPYASIDPRQHLDYLHEPENLFLACCILATNEWNAFSETLNRLLPLSGRLSEICRDIRALVSLRPSDPSWDQCRRKLRSLLQDEGGYFLSSSRNGRYVGMNPSSPRRSMKRRVIFVRPWECLMKSFLIQ
ncbi:hypothetical protein DFS33DRAFT_9722 [Desarmillaria ectypa]|nr:hypothetical protein DFS33DRAFT_9722 [Desarmillaria ectypa]